MQNRILIPVGALILTIVFTWLFYQEWSFFRWMDSLFLTGLSLLVVGFMMILIEGQFFSAFIRSTKHFFASISKKEQVIREVEEKKESAPGYRKHFPSSKIYLSTGVTFCVISLLISVIYVYFGR
ncbi:hypothetical protein GCM10008967_03600 [Bacillus carboniphilus]|uniref:DUF3899 domain-containing protein n=1 Tax=Bacillus carboniphilus TaxID=86663 RepID=A0ABN0VSP2_9BACI